MINTTNYGFNIVEGTDIVNPLVQLNPNFSNLDTILKGVSDATISPATCIKSGTTHTVTRSNAGANVLKFTATGDWLTGDTLIIDGVTVTPYLPTGEALTSGAFIINTEVIMAISGTRATVYTNLSNASSTSFDDTDVLFTASNVQDAIEGAATASGTEYSAGVSVKDKIDSFIIEDITSLFTYDAQYSIWGTPQYSLEKSGYKFLGFYATATNTNSPATPIISYQNSYGRIRGWDGSYQFVAFGTWVKI